jgi:hypothetical protein
MAFEFVKATQDPRFLIAPATVRNTGPDKLVYGPQVGSVDGEVAVGGQATFNSTKVVRSPSKAILAVTWPDPVVAGAQGPPGPQGPQGPPGNPGSQGPASGPQEVIPLGNISGNVPLDLQGKMSVLFTAMLTGNVTLSYVGAGLTTPGQWAELRTTQGAGGPYTITFPAGRWPDGAPGQVTQVGGAIDRFGFQYVGPLTFDWFPVAPALA